jgi:hypothetical protein
VAHLWLRDDADTWAVLPLEGAKVELADIPVPLGRALGASSDAPLSPLLVRTSEGTRPEWALVASASSGVSIDGVPLRTGLRVLADRTEVHIAGAGSVFFSEERLPRVEVPASLGQAGRCPRCDQPIEVGTPLVRCPKCDVAHHQSDELPCWTYHNSGCALCSRPTDLDAGFQWTPEDL